MEIEKIQVDKDTLIGELMEIDITTAPILMSIGMHCIGCPSSQMETLEEAAWVHGIDADELVNEINAHLLRRYEEKVAAAKEAEGKTE
ncbi:MAG: DUF1858 domain-containing protein [Lachnospiraceae bacterium]|nr:DUF1858 domain-containing protein [Lachnospiraceae bacterium]